MFKGRRSDGWDGGGLRSGISHWRGNPPSLFVPEINQNTPMSIQTYRIGASIWCLFLIRSFGFVSGFACVCCAWPATFSGLLDRCFPGIRCIPSLDCITPMFNTPGLLVSLLLTA